MRLFLLMMIGAVVLSACSGSDPQGDGRLVVLDDNNVIVMDRNGENRLAITDTEATGPDRTFNFQPIWSPDGSFIAFSTISPETGLHVATADGDRSWSIDTSTLPFYFSWSAEDDLAMLRNADDGNLRLDRTFFDGDELAEPTMLETGAPLYFSWSPDGAHLATHIGQDRLEKSDLESSQPLGPQPGAFLAPQWTDRGIFAVEQGSRDQALVIIDPDEGSSQPLAVVRGPTTFVATRDGTRLAVETNVAETNSVSAAYQQTETITPNRVVVIDTDSGEQTTVTEDPAIAFFWSPQGDKLLILDVDDAGAARWSTWTDGEPESVVSFELDGSFLRDFLPFFNQYAQSMSLWSPDGSAFAFPGTIDGESGIWVKSGDDDVVRISNGTWVSWSS